MLIATESSILAMEVTYTEYWENGIKYRKGSDGSVWVYDPGGETNFGISKRSYPNYDIKNMTKEQAQVIYLIDYWTPLACYNLPWPHALFVFDVGVLCGVGHTLPLRGLAPSLFLAKHLQYLTNISTFERFGRGWTRRVADLLTYL